MSIRKNRQAERTKYALGFAHGMALTSSAVLISIWVVMYLQ